MTSNNRRSSGVLGLDPVLDGGFPRGTTIIVMGSPLAGVDLLARQFWKTDDEGGAYLMLDSEIEEGMIDAQAFAPGQIPPHFTGQRIVVDSLSSIILQHGIEAALSCMTCARDEVARTGSNIMFILYTNIHTAREEIRVLRTADVVIELREVTHATEVDRQLAVRKVKNNQVTKRLIPFNITEKGIELSTTSRVV
ncbi:MAG TPA: ATPase domain-containing protein [Methanoregulaceae archaeon]|nr:ATPase domain-containing protein [Methanoregulaceae archaeon]HPD09399.1 ATPase domain-containing protein [Methanoregulaceae archaeon]HRT14808.1 ATPase domain-containing protein [Methanoregulaceae archaeon]HRU30381.1 ATPase domain-containing protein [Methanoregulaceae archaeon]